MANDSTPRDQEFRNDLDDLALPPEERERIVHVMEKMMEMGIAVVYGEEDPDAPDAVVDCADRIDECRSICCTYRFSLTREEVEQGRIQYEPSRPYFIKRDPDGYCPHLDRKSLKCSIWNVRPLRCRQYDCRDDREVWPTINTTD